MQIFSGIIVRLISSKGRVDILGRIMLIAHIVTKVFNGEKVFEIYDKFLKAKFW